VEPLKIKIRCYLNHPKICFLNFNIYFLYFNRFEVEKDFFDCLKYYGVTDGEEGDDCYHENT
jgi:hypothetical protein